MNNYYICEIVDYSTEHILNKIKDDKIYVLQFKKLDNYLYHLKVDIKNYQKLLKVFPNLKVIHTHGLFFIIKNRLIQKITIISLIIGTIFFVFLSHLIYKVEIYGNNSRITNNISLILKENKIDKYQFIPNDSKMEEIKNLIMQENIEIENIDFQTTGTIVKVVYYLKEKENKHYVEYGKYYAKKDGVIAYIDIEAGNFLFSTNDYVKKGELLIDDYLHVDDKSIYLGGYGKVYAYTWVIVELSLTTSSYLEADIYTKLCMDARYNVSKNFSDDEKIEKENILSFKYDKDKSYIKIHYTLLENIAILQKN